jgi:hypothetical protein
MVRAYFFLAVFFVAFFAGLDAFFVAIMLTTFHAVRDLPVAHSWHNTPERSGNMCSNFCGETMERRRPMTLQHWL